MTAYAFSPLGNNVTIVKPAGASTAAQAIPGATAGQLGAGESAMVYNASATVAFIKFGDSNVADATALDTPLPPNSNLPFSIAPGVTHCKVFAATADGSVYVQRGGGM